MNRQTRVEMDTLFDGSDSHLIQHVIPTNDLREHVTDGDCWCSPTIDQEHLIVIHNSMDERETYEEGRKPQ